MGKKREKNFSKFQKKSNSSTKNDTGTNLTSNPGVTDASNSPKSKKFFSKKSDSKKGSDHDEQTNFFTEKSSNVDTMKEWSNQEDKLDERFGFSRITEIFGEAKLGFLVNIQPTIIEDKDNGISKSAVDLYFIQQSGETFKVALEHKPYFYLGIRKKEYFVELENYLKSKYDRFLATTEQIEKEDLELKNHLSGLKKTYLKLNFYTVQGLLQVRSDLLPLVKKNQDRLKISEVYQYNGENNNSLADQNKWTFLDSIEDIREYDIPYYMRVAIDKDLRCGCWYKINSPSSGVLNIEIQPEIVKRADMKVLAFDIETTKSPLMFPDAQRDNVMMISYMLDGEGFLIVNKEIVSEDINDFEYSPKPEFPGPFTVFNVQDEKSLLQKFFDHIKETKPNIFITFNGDFFDWPFVETRAKHYNINMFHEIGVKSDQGEFKCRYGSHLDAFYWVKRDSYLPQGSQGLKAVTKAKLGYNPVELDPEKMVEFAHENPQALASYSVSDAVATYYLYMKYVHPFIYSLCSIIPMNPDDVLRKGSGTLCEYLLMTEAFKGNIIFPNKQANDVVNFYNGHLLESETYIGGHVEALQSGVFRNDIQVPFKIDTETLDKLISELDDTLEFTIAVEAGLKKESITNYDEIKANIQEKLLNLKSIPKRKECPVIYHLDVSAMYPNIILTNRLQPTAVVNEEICAVCDFNKPENRCQRKLKWTWNGDFIPADRLELEGIRKQLETERFPDPKGKKEFISFYELPQSDQNSKLKSRLKDYSKKVYKVTHQEVEEERESIICMRENPFYVDTVRAFRDRRYIYKDKLKQAQREYERVSKENKSEFSIQEASKMIILYDSLQLAHKCILNSFYGYVMRRGARWYSMETAGAVTYTGAKIITQSREIIEKIGVPLELDTDGIWCILPQCFPQNFKFLSTDPKRPNYVFSYPCIILNKNLRKDFTNDQYQTLNPVTRQYETREECSIFFELDGPYRAMILPAAKEEGKKLKKRYAVFNTNGTLAELKGFEVKRRGELKLIKTFQSQIFEKFLEGKNLEECYQAAASVATDWLDLIQTKGESIEDNELLELLTQSTSMSKQLEEYGNRKSSAITAAKRLAEFLGDQRIKDKGLTCSFIISKYPLQLPITERVIPTLIFAADEVTRHKFLQKWCPKNNNNIELRELIDWDYYRERLVSVIHKIITIPASIQKVKNPVPGVSNPEWVQRTYEGIGNDKQSKISDMFQKKSSSQASDLMDLEDIENFQPPKNKISFPKITLHKRTRDEFEEESTSINQTTQAEESEISLRNNNKEEEEDTMEVEELESDHKTDKTSSAYKEWLKEQKGKWKKQRESRFKRKEIFGSNSRRSDSQMVRFIQHRKSLLVSNVWEIIQIAETRTPGEFIVWALVDNELQSIPIKVQRKFFLNSREQNSKMKPVSFTLPRSKPRFYLYEYAMDETEYKANSKAISTLFTRSEVEGVYETQIPLLLQAVIRLGCHCKVSTKNFTEPILLDFLVAAQSKNPYLSSNTLKKLFLYHSHSDSKGILVLFSESEKIAYVYVIASYSLQLGPIKRILNENYQKFEMNIEHSKTLKQAYSSLDKILIDYKSTGSTVIMVETASLFDLNQNIPTLSEFPNISIPFNDQDNKFNLFGWETQVTNILVSRINSSSQWYDTHLQYSRYASVPIGNIEGDFVIYMSDILLARSLRKNNHLLWISNSSLPDLGGSEEDEFHFAEELVNPEIYEPGCYKNSCIELDLVGLAVDTVLEANRINEIEGGNNFLNFDLNPTVEDSVNKNLKTFDETTSSVKSFRILKSLITEWSCDVGKNSLQNSESSADLFIAHFYRWVSNPHSRLYDPVLHKALHSLMKKVFWQLIAEFRKVGATIIYANFNKIILSTNKTNYNDVKSYCDFVLKNIKKKDLFAWLDIEPNRYWDNLLFLDQANFGGKIAGSSNNSETSSSRNKIISNWNIAEYLPETIQQHFLLIVSDFILNLSKTTDNTSSSKTDIDLFGAFKENHNPNAFSSEMDIGVSNNNVINSNFTQKLFHIIQDIQRYLRTQTSNDSKNIPLEFVKTICKVLSLDKTLDDEVFKLKKSLLKLINVREFSKESEFTNPCSSFILCDEICTFCNASRDMDFLRDPNLLHGKWNCIFCDHPFNKAAIEAKLVEIVQKKSLSYQQQDLICEKCKQVKAENMLDTCSSCYGKFKCKLSTEEFTQILHTFQNIAQTHKFKWLEETISTMLFFHLPKFNV